MARPTRVSKTRKPAYKRKRISGVNIPRSLKGLVRTNRNFVAANRSAKGFPEKKYHDCLISGTGIPKTSLYIVQEDITKILQDTSSTGRVGNKITVTNINAKMRINTGPVNNTFSTNIPVGFRVMLIRDKQTNGSSIDMNTVLDPYTIEGAQEVSINSFRNMDNVDRYDILYDKTFMLQPGAAVFTSTGQACVWNTGKHIKISKKVLDRVEYGGSTGTMANMRSISYALVVIPDSNCAEEILLGIQGNLRVKYTDM